MELKIHSLVIVSYGAPSGSIEASFGETKLKFDLTCAEAAEVHALAIHIVQAHQAAIAHEVASARPALLISPDDASWEHG